LHSSLNTNKKSVYSVQHVRGDVEERVLIDRLYNRPTIPNYTLPYPIIPCQAMPYQSIPFISYHIGLLCHTSNWAVLDTPVHRISLLKQQIL